MLRRFLALSVASAALLLAACQQAGTAPSSVSAPSSSASTAGASAPATGRITVFAAASLQGSFTTLGKRFEAAHPGSAVAFDFGPSSGLATQIVQGAPADVFASASTATMDQVAKAGLARDSAPFARNTMEIAVPAANPGRVGGIADLVRPSVTVALCQPQVPCGATALRVLGNAGLKLTPVTQEVDVKAVLSKVSLDEVDAGMVYVTDVRTAGARVKGVPIPARYNATTSYPIAAVATSAHRATAEAFVRYVLSPAGAAVLVADGFLKP